MRRQMRIGFVVLALAALAPAIASAEERETGKKRVTFFAPTPCAAACPYWQDPTDADKQNALACAKSPRTVPGSWADKRVRVPAKVAGHKPFALIFRISPRFDYDSFICQILNPGKANERWVFSETGANAAGDTCATLVAFGCEEEPVVVVKPGQVFVLRVYNFSDPNPSIIGEYAWTYKR